MNSYKLVRQLPPLPSTRRGYSADLSTDSKQENLLYSHGRSVIIRNIKNPSICKGVVKHQCEVSATAYAGHGNYIASGDMRGNVIVWATDNEDNTIKTQFQPLAGRINGLAWDSTSTRLATVGEGKERFGHVCLMETQSNIGLISSHMKPINSVCYKQAGRKLIATGSDDYTVAVYSGPPFVTERILNDHTRFVHCTRFSPNSKFLASCGADGLLYVYNVEKTVEKVAALTPPLQNEKLKTLFSLSWEGDSSKIMTSSASGKLYSWDLETNKILNTIDVGKGDSVGGQQVSCIVLDSSIISLSLSRDINYIDKRTGEIFEHITGHRGGITTLTIDPDFRIWSSGYQGVTCMWDINATKPYAACPRKDIHTLDVIDSVSGRSGLYSISADLTLSYMDYSDNSLVSKISIPDTPLHLAVHTESDICIITLENQHICFANKDGIKGTEKLSYKPSAIALSSSKNIMAIGSQSGETRLYRFNGTDTSLGSEILVLSNNKGCVSSIDFSPDGLKVAVGDALNKIMVYDIETGKLLINKWVFHSSKVNCVRWAPDSKHAASGSLDTTVEVWSVDSPMKHMSINPAHYGSVTSLAWTSPNTFVTAGYDAVLKEWLVSF